MINFAKFWNGIKIKAKAVLNSDSMGEIEVDSSSGKLNYHNGTTRSPAVTEAHSATLTNKTIDADLNTITNIENADIKVGAAIDASKIADGSVSNAEFQNIGALGSAAVGISDVQTLSNKSLVDSSTAVVDSVDATIQVKIDAAGSTGTKTTLLSSQTVDRILTLPNATDTLVGKATTDTLTNKAIDSDLNTLSNIKNADIKSGANIALSKLAPLTASKATVTDGSGVITTSATTSTEIGYVAGLTSAVQTQLDSKIPLTQKGAANGVATLDAGGKVPATQLPSSVMTYEGTWNASTNTPTLADGTGDAGMVYLVSVAGTQNLGSGSLTFKVGDWVVYSGTVWQKSTNSNEVLSVNGQTGVVVLTKSDVGLSNVDNTSDATKNSATVTLTNKSLDDSTTFVVDTIDPTKKIGFNAAGTTGTKTTITSSQTVDRTITLPDVSGTVITTGDTGTITSTMIADGTIVNADINASAAITRSKLASGTNNALQANNGSGVLSDITDITVGTNSLTLANTKHLELQAVTDSTTTGSNASLASFNSGVVRLTNASLLSLANIPAGADGQQLIIINRTGVDISVVDSSSASGTAANRILTGTAGNVTMKKDAAFQLEYDSTTARWQLVGGTGSGTGTSVSLPDVLTIQDFDNAALTDFTQTGLALSATNPIKGTKTALLTHQAVTTQSFKQVIAVDRKFRGYSNTLALSVRSSALASNLTLLVTDETNSATLLASTQITTGQITSAVFNTASSTTVTVTDTSILNQLKVGASITGSGIPANTVISATPSTGATAGTITISNAATATATGVALKVSNLPAKQTFSFTIPQNCASISYTVTALAEAGSPESYVDDVQIYLGQTAASSYSLTIPVNNDTDWTSYTPTFTGVGTPISSNFKYKRKGGDLLIEGVAEMGTPTATPLSFTLPSGLNIDPTRQVYFGIFAVNGDATFTNAGGTSGVYVSDIGSRVLSQSGTTNALFFGTKNNTDASSTVIAGPVNGNLYNTNSQFAVTNIKIPIAGWSENTTTTSTIPLTSSVLVTQPDSYLRITGFNAGANGSTATKIATLSSGTIQQNLGTAIQYIDDSVNGARFIARQEGTYRFQYSGDINTSAGTGCGFSLNSSTLTTDYASLTSAEKIAVSNDSGASGIITVFGEAFLRIGDIVRVHRSGVTSSSDTSYSSFTASYLGSIQILNPSTDQKVTIPTHQLRFQGSSARGSTDTGIVKFDTQTITIGDGFTVVNTAANGTVVTITKAGMLSGNATISSGSTSPDVMISLNQAVLTTTPTLSEILAYNEASAATFNSGPSFAQVPVKVGDKIRVFSDAAPSGSFNFLSLTLQEQSVAVALQNVTPTYDNSDSAVRIYTGNGFGSTNTTIRRYSNIAENFGTDVTYTDSATLGASFTVNKDGLYTLSATDACSNGPTSFFITKNSIVNSAISNLATSSAVTSGVTNAACEVYLQKGDIIRVLAETAANFISTYANATFQISRVGKTSGTVDVTPFVQIPTLDTDAIEMASSTTFGSTNTGIAALTASKNTNAGVIRLVSDSVTGSYIEVLKECILSVTTVGRNNGVGQGNVAITRNSTTTGLSFPNNSIGYSTTVATNGFVSTVASGIKGYVGDKIRIHRDSTNISLIDGATITAIAATSSVASPTQQVSSDTMSFVFKSTAIDPNTDAIGTFNTYTVAANTNTYTIATTAPTQTTSSMNINGIQVFARAYNASSTAASPARVDVFIGKGLKATQVSAYTSTGKSIAMCIDGAVQSTNEYGTRYEYSETTGILTIESAIRLNSANTGAFSGIGSDASTPSSGYFVFNASKTPSLVTVPNLVQRVAYLSDVKASGTAGGANNGTVYATRTLNTLVDNTGIVTSLASNQFILPAGTYRISGSAPAYLSNGHRIRLRNITDSTTSMLGNSARSVADAVTHSIIDGEITITSAKTFELQHFTTTTQATNGFGVPVSSGESEVYTQLAITKIK